MTSWIVKFPFKVGHLPQFTPWAFNVMRYLRVPLLWSFLPMSMPLGRLWFLEATFLIYASALGLHWVPLAAELASPTAAGSTIPCSAVFFCDSIYVLLKFYFQRYHSSFLCHTFIVVSQFPLSMIHVGKMSHGFFTGRDGSNTTTCFAICVWPEWWALSDPSLTDFERREVIGHWLWCAPVISVVIGGLKT